MAACHIVAAHSILLFFPGASGWPRTLIESAAPAVSFFFILSGFVLAYTHGSAPEELNRRKFWAGRFARIVPIYYVGLILDAPPSIGRWVGGPGESALGTVLSNLTATQAFVPAFACKWNCPGWSISVEVFCYLLFPFVLMLWRPRAPQRWWVWALLCWVASLTIATMYTRYYPIPDPSSPWMGFIQYSPLVRLPEFLIGVFLASGYRSAASRPRWWASSLGIVALLAIIAVVTTQVGRIPFAFYHNAFLAPVHALLVLALAVSSGAMARFLSSPALLLLGNASFALYISHRPLLYPIASFGWLGLGAMASYFVVAVLLAVGLYVYVERPSRAWIRRRLDV